MAREHIKHIILEETKDFCGETSIHGLNQIANDTSPIFKRLLWFVIFAGSLVYAGQQLAESIKGLTIKSQD